MPLIPLLGYAPDLNPLEAGVLTNCSAFIPSTKGMEAAPSAQSVTLAALAAACKGTAVLRKLDNSTRFIAGTATALYEAGTSTWADRTRAAGGAYTLGSSTRWRFAMFGDTVFAAAKSDILQSSSSTTFANAAANAPKAGGVETANGFVFLFDVNDQGGIYDSADRPHGWWAARDPTVWTPSIANEAFTGELTSTPGKIKAGRRFGKAIVFYKDRSMYLGGYVGQTGWEFELIPGDAGAMSQEVVVDVGTPDNPKHIFMGVDDFFSYDGSRPVPIGSPVRETVFGELNRQYSHAAMALHDRLKSRIYFFYPVENSDNPSKCVVYNYRTNRWGRDDRTVEAVVEYIASGVTWDDLGTLYPTWDALPALPWDTAFLSADSPSPAIFNTSNAVQTLTGVAGTSSYTTGDIGADNKITLVSRVIPTFLTRPNSGTLTPKHRMSLGDLLTTDAQVSMTSKGRFDFMRSANWHRFVIEFSGDTEVVAMQVDLQEDGEE